MRIRKQPSDSAAFRASSPVSGPVRPSPARLPFFELFGDSAPRQGPAGLAREASGFNGTCNPLPIC
jgi:hypothetical protein